MATDGFFHTFCQSRGFYKKKMTSIAGGRIQTKQEGASTVNGKKYRLQAG